MDLIVRRAQLTDRPSGQHLDIGIDGGRSVAIEPNLAAERATYDAAERLVRGGLVETHIHLDKPTFSIGVRRKPGATSTPALHVRDQAGDFEGGYLRARGARVKECILRGTTHIRTQVQVDPLIGMLDFGAGFENMDLLSESACRFLNASYIALRIWVGGVHRRQSTLRRAPAHAGRPVA